jgi:hypothetical protein
LRAWIRICIRGCQLDGGISEQKSEVYGAVWGGFIIRDGSIKMNRAGGENLWTKLWGWNDTGGIVNEFEKWELTWPVKGPTAEQQAK